MLGGQACSAGVGGSKALPRRGHTLSKTPHGAGLITKEHSGFLAGETGGRA
jgi:hypothetical protein